jgi:hypothetical protein
MVQRDNIGEMFTKQTATYRMLFYWIWYVAVSASGFLLDFSLSPTETIN